MPWHIEDDNSNCSGYAVVQNDTDEVVGCHDTLSDAEDQLAALYANAKRRLLPWGEAPC